MSKWNTNKYNTIHAQITFWKRATELHKMTRWCCLQVRGNHLCSERQLLSTSRVSQPQRVRTTALGRDFYGELRENFHVDPITLLSYLKNKAMHIMDGHAV